MALALGAAVSPATAVAQTASEIEQAKQWFSTGLELEEKGEFAAALDNFRKALGVKRTPQIEFHVGLCQAKVGALVDGLATLERALELAKAEGNATVQSAATSELAALRPRVPMLELVVRGGDEPLSVKLDGRSLEPARLGSSLPVDPGQHEVVAEFASGEVKRSFAVAERGKVSIEISAPSSTGATAEGPAPAPVPSAPPPAPPAAPAPEPKATGAVLPWVLMGSGVVLAAGGFYAWKLRGDQIDELDAMCPSQSTCPEGRAAEVDDLESKGKTYSAIGIGLWSVGAAALATGGYLWLGASDEKAASARLVPSIGPRGAGAVLRASF